MIQPFKQAFEIAMRRLFIRLSLYRNIQLSVQAVLCPYLRQKPRLFQEPWVPPTENCSSDSAVASITVLHPLAILGKSRQVPHRVSGKRQTNPRTADWGPAAPLVATHATRRRRHAAAVRSATVRAGSTGTLSSHIAWAISVQIA
jgi:hypothetical protein